MVVPLLLPIVRPVRIRWIVAPGIDTPVCSPCRLLPFGFRRQPLAGPLAIVVRILPIDIHNRAVLMGGWSMVVHIGGGFILWPLETSHIARPSLHTCLYNRHRERSRCTGFSSSLPSLLPIVNSPAGTSTIWSHYSLLMIFSGRALALIVRVFERLYHHARRYA